VDQTRTIVAELQDRVEELFAEIEQLREARGDGKESRGVVEAIFRSVHSFKASATANNLQSTAQIAHELENLLHSLRAGKCRINAAGLQLISDTAEVMSASLIARTANLSQEEQAIVERLSKFATQSSDRERFEVEFIINSIPQNILQSVNATELHRLRESIGEGAIPYLIETSFDTHDFDQQFQQLQSVINLNGEVISTSPQVDAERLDKINFRILYTRDADLEQVKQELSSLSEVTIKELIPTKPVAAISTATEDESHSNPTPVESGPDTIRISLDDLDRVISLTYSLVRTTNASLDLAINSATEPSTELAGVADSVGSSLLQLAAKLVNLRMVSIDRTLQRALRAGRSAAWSTGKDINFVVRGRDLVIDKSLADSIADPLIHLVRNAVAHGIEDPEQRASTAKSPTATISIEASTIQGQTRIAVSDDGRGIDPQLIAEAAKRLGVLKSEESLDMAQSVRLLFRSGFSTAKEVSGLSGRGVGLDAVESNIEEIGGAITVASEPGQWSRFEIRLPVTFGLLDVMVVASGGHRYLIDRSYISSYPQLERNEIEASEVGPQTRAGDENIRIVDLNTLVGGTAADIKAVGASLLICELTQTASERPIVNRVGLVVDSITENQRVLVRNLGSHGGRWFGVAGAAEMRDGRVALLLDLPRLLSERANN
jgi:two-component system chemotaxis sensor kinase CheA